MRTSQALILSFLVSTAACAQTKTYPPGKASNSGTMTVNYCGTQKMDIMSANSPIGAKPVILYIHGGGWETGSRKGGFERRRLKPLMENGFTVATLDYRLAPIHKHPAQIHDVKCAIKYLRANNAALNIDPERLGLMGDSAGGHLAALAGLTSSKDGLEGSSLKSVSSDVKAVATFYGIFDVVNVEADSLAVHAVSKAFTDRAAKVQGSPVVYIDKDDPPFLIMHGEEDKFVNVAQSVKLAVMLKDKEHAPLLVAVENAGHGFVRRTGKPKPNNETLDELLIAFFSEYLKEKPS